MSEINGLEVDQGFDNFGLKETLRERRMDKILSPSFSSERREASTSNLVELYDTVKAHRQAAERANAA